MGLLALGAAAAVGVGAWLAGSESSTTRTTCTIECSVCDARLEAMRQRAESAERELRKVRDDLDWAEIEADEMRNRRRKQ